MNATFSRKTVRKGDKRVDVEWVTISGLPAGDVVSRAATDKDRSRFKEAYRAFKTPLTPPTSKQVKAHAAKG